MIDTTMEVNRLWYINEDKRQQEKKKEKKREGRGSQFKDTVELGTERAEPPKTTRLQNSAIKRVSDLQEINSKDELTMMLEEIKKELSKQTGLLKKIYKRLDERR